MALLKRPLRWTGAVLAAALLLVPAAMILAAPPTARARETALESAVKANYLYKFAPFVDWPPSAFANPSAPFVICIGGEDPFGQALDDAVRGQLLSGRRILVRRLASPASAGACQVLFIGKTRGGQGAELLKAVAGKPVLTVADQDRGVTGAMIEFVLKDGRVRFTIDADTAQAGGLTISSKLLGLALSVKRTAR